MKNINDIVGCDIIENLEYHRKVSSTEVGFGDLGKIGKSGYVKALKKLIELNIIYFNDGSIYQLVDKKYNATDLWNYATKLPIYECNGYWKALNDLTNLNIIYLTK